MEDIFAQTDGRRPQFCPVRKPVIFREFRSIQALDQPIGIPYYFYPERMIREADFFQFNFFNQSPVKLISH
jgi:hypothetical protein